MKSSRRSETIFPVRESRSTTHVTYTKNVRQSNRVSSTDQLDLFEISSFPDEELPKTDYTYARSGSYSPKQLDKPYLTPNMSRRGLRRLAASPETSTPLMTSPAFSSNMVTPPGTSYGYTPRSARYYIQDSGSDTSIVPTRHVEVKSPGMILRSGARLTRTKRLRFEDEERRSVRNRGKSSLQLQQDYMNRNNSNASSSMRSNSMLLRVVDDSDEYGSDVSSSTQSSGINVDSMVESDQIDTSSVEYRIHAGGLSDYVLDSEDELIDQRPRRRQHNRRREHHEEQGTISWFFMCIVSVVNSVTTVAEYLKYAASAVTSSIWTEASAVTSLLWTYLLRPVYTVITDIITLIDIKVQWFIAYFVILDAWLHRNMRSCCLCLSLLLLLPLLLGGGGYYYLYKTDWKAGSIFRETTVVTEGGPRQWLTEGEIKELVKAMMGLQMDNLQLNVINIAKEETMKASQSDLNLRFEALEATMRDLFAKNREEIANIVGLYNEMRPLLSNSLTREDIGELVQSMVALKIEGLKLDILSVAQEGSSDKDVTERLDGMEKRLAALLAMAEKKNVQEEVHQTLVQLRAEKGDWLTQEDIEALIRDMLTSQMESLRLSLLSSFQQGSAQQGDGGVTEAEVKLRINAVEEQLAELRDNTQLQTSGLTERIQLILGQFRQDGQHDWLTKPEIEALIKKSIGSQLEAFHLSMLTLIKEGKGGFEVALKASQEDATQKLDILGAQLEEYREKAKVTSGRLDSLEQQLKGFVGTGKLSEEEIASLTEQLMGAIFAVRDKMEEKVEEDMTRQRERWEAELSKMELTIADLRTMIQSSQSSSHGQVIALSEKCCKDEASLLALIRGEVARLLADRDQGGVVAGKVSSEEIKGIVDAALLKYSADKIGMPDYALESSGGSIVNIRCSNTYTKRSATVKVWGIPIFYSVNGPRAVIQPDVLPGNCWPFEGQTGCVVIQLATPIIPTMFTLEHIDKGQSVYGDNKSAPKDFLVLGLSSESDTEGVELGRYRYDAAGIPIQQFNVQMPDPGVFFFIELRVLNNHGNKEYTCLYRFRVHGIPKEHN